MSKQDYLEERPSRKKKKKAFGKEGHKLDAISGKRNRLKARKYKTS